MPSDGVICVAETMLVRGIAAQEGIAIVQVAELHAYRSSSFCSPWAKGLLGSTLWWYKTASLCLFFWLSRVKVTTLTWSGPVRVKQQGTNSIHNVIGTLVPEM